MGLDYWQKFNINVIRIYSIGAVRIFHQVFAEVLGNFFFFFFFFFKEIQELLVKVTRMQIL